MKEFLPDETYNSLNDKFKSLYDTITPPNMV